MADRNRDPGVKSIETQSRIRKRDVSSMMDKDNGYSQDCVAVANKKLKTNSSPHVSHGSQTTQNKDTLYSRLSKPDQEKLHKILFSAIHSNCLDLLKEILQTGVNIDNIKNKDGATPLCLALDQDCTIEVIKVVMTPKQIGIKCKPIGLSPLHKAVIKGKYELVQHMIKRVQSPLSSPNQEQQRSQQSNSNHGIINRKNKHGWTPLHYAANNGYIDILRVLVMEKNCDVTSVNRQGHTAFHLAACKGHLACLKELFAAAEASESLPSPPAMDKRGWNIACHASAQDNTEVMEWLIDNMSSCGADVNLPNKKGATPLLIACEYQNIEMFKLLYDKCSEVTALTKDKKCVLHVAALHDADQISEFVLAKGDFPIDLEDKYGETALHIAYKRGSYKVQELLISEGADKTIKNKEGQCPKDVQFKNHEIPAEIKRQGKEAIKKYLTELRKGKIKMPRCKLMILGEAGVGKTSLLSVLTGEDFNPEHNETKGIDTDLVNTFTIRTDTWEKRAMKYYLLHEEYKEIAASVLAKFWADNKSTTVKPSKQKAVIVPDNSIALKQQFDMLMKKYTQQQSQSVPPKPKATSRPRVSETQFSISSPFHNVQPNPTIVNRPPPHQPSFLPQPAPAFAPPLPVVSVRLAPAPLQSNPPSVVSHLKEKRPVISPLAKPLQNVPSDPNSTQKDIFKLATKLRKQKQIITETPNLPLKFSSFDFAGQDHYKPMHHCFISSRAVYVVAFNVRHLLEEEHRCIEELKFWVNSIHVYTDAKMVLVGTHRGPYNVPGPRHLNALTPEEDKYIKTIMKKHFDRKDYVQQLQFFENSIMATVENSIRGDDSEGGNGADIIREKLSNLGDDHSGNKDDLPISYLQLELHIFMERQRHQDGLYSLVSREDVADWASQYGIDDSSVPLKFFHDIGTIIDPSKLPILFVTKEQMARVQDVILISPQWLADVMKELMQLRRNSGYDPEALHQLNYKGIIDRYRILCPLLKKYHGGEPKLLEQICILLQSYGLIIPVNQRSSLYYVPCKLPTSPTQDNTLVTQTNNCSKFRVSFQHRFLPPFVLHHLMFLMYSSAKSDGQRDNCCFLKTQCFIEWVNNCQWWLNQSNDTIHVTVRTRKSICTILPAMQYLHEQLKTVLKGLNNIDYHLGPVAVCSECKEEQLLTYITYGNDDWSDYLQCEGCGYHDDIDHNNKRIVSKAYTITFKELKKGIYRLNQEIKEYLIKKFKRTIQKEFSTDDNSSWNDDDILELWYENKIEKKQDPWPEVMSALDTCTLNSTEEVVKFIKQEHLHLYMSTLN